jgi:hypothetical protein
VIVKTNTRSKKSSRVETRDGAAPTGRWAVTCPWWNGIGAVWRPFRDPLNARALRGPHGTMAAVRYSTTESYP